MSLRSTPVVRALGTIPRTLGPSRGFRAAAGRKALNENDRGTCACFLAAAPEPGVGAAEGKAGPGLGPIADGDAGSRPR